MEAFIKSLVRDAGREALSRFRTHRRLRNKANTPWSAVTDADIAVEKMMKQRILKKYPTHGIIGEETGTHRTESEYVWILDPIDGTLNYSTGVPLFGCMAALAYKKNVILSAIHLPVTDELFFAKAGKGTYLNEKRVRCSNTSLFERSIGCGFSSIRMRTAPFIRRIFKAIGQEQVVFNSFGAISVNAAYVACGRRDWIVAPHGELHDFAPVSLILKEAGCKVVDALGKDWKYGAQGIVATNPVLSTRLVKYTRS